MLSIGIVSATGGRYYMEFARSDYYVAGGESPGMWHVNEASFWLGFHGVVDKQQIDDASLMATIREPGRYSPRIMAGMTGVPLSTCVLACLRTCRPCGR